VAFVRTEVLEERMSSIFRSKRISELATMLAVAFFIVTAVKTSNHTN
jgi:hypothetical protein